MRHTLLLLAFIPLLFLGSCGGGSGSSPATAPSTPTGITIVLGDSQTRIDWSAVSGATAYNVYYRSTAGVTKANGAKIAGVASGDTITGLTNGMTYYFVVTAQNGSGESAESDEVSATPASPAGAWTTKTSMVAQRDNAANVVLNGKIYVLGGAPAGISILDSMEMYTPAIDTWATKAPLPAWSAFKIIPPWESYGTPPYLPTYRYGPAAASVNGLIYAIGGTSLVSGQGPIYATAVYDPNTDSWSTSVPTNAATTAASTAGQPLAPIPTGRWGFDVAVVDGLLYAVGGAVHVPGNIDTTEANITKITGATSGAAINLANWSHYYFFVTAVDGSGVESAPSSHVSALLRSIYAAGEGSAAGDGQATITWMETSGATSYNLYYSTHSGVIPQDAAGALPAGITKVSGISATPNTASATVTGLSNGTPYYFIATAVTPSGEIMATSEEISVTPQAAPDASVPSNVAVISGDGQATLNWTSVAGATSYNVYYGTGTNFYYGAVEAYDPVANTWTTKASMPSPRWGATVSVVNGLIYAIGGWGGWPELSVVEIYDPATNTWSTTVPTNPATTAAGTSGAPLTAMPTARDDFGYAVVNGTIYAIGGDINAFNDAARISCCTTVVEAYNPVMNTWTTQTAMPTIRDDFDASVVDGTIYAIAGSRDGQFTPAASLLPIDPAKDGGFSLTTVEAFSTSTIPVPNGVVATTGANQASLNWNAVTGATAYNVYWSNKAGVSTASGTKINNGTSTAYTHTGLTPGSWYYYIVTAVTASGESLPSNEVAVEP